MSAPAINLTEARVNRGLSVRGAAKQMGIDFKTLMRAERGEVVPQARNAFAIADFYGYKVTEVWPLEPSSPSPESLEAA